MLAHSVAGALERFTEALRVRYGGRLEEIALFGSHARGEAHEESDVDVLVVIIGLTDDDRRDVLDLAYRIDSSSDDWVGISPLVYSTEQIADLRARERRLVRDIDREGIRL